METFPVFLRINLLHRQENQTGGQKTGVLVPEEGSWESHHSFRGLDTKGESFSGRDLCFLNQVGTCRVPLPRRLALTRFFLLSGCGKRTAILSCCLGS